MNETDAKFRPEPHIIPRSEHTITRANISNNALKVLYRLNNAGHQAFLVGGGVRDLLLGGHPKDFDVVTDAHPEEIKRLFRNARLIGRRFRLAHVRFGREIIEVATFRAAAANGGSESGDENLDRSHSESGRILRDNVYGSIDEDVWRRDFTINALYYNIADYSVWDYTSGFDDVRDRVLRLIGDPATRYREDPVRMLRAVRFAAKLGFEMAPETAAPLEELGDSLLDVPAARLFDEVLKLFQTGHAVKSLESLLQFDLIKYLFPETAAVLASPDGVMALEFIRQGLANTDSRIAEGKSVTPMFLYAVLLWPAIRRATEHLQAADGFGEYDAVTEASYRVTAEQQRHTLLPKRFSVPMREMLTMQRRFLSRRGARAARFLEHKRFRAAYDFLVLRSRTGEVDPELADWWTEIQTRSPAEQQRVFGVKGRRGRQERPRSAPSVDR